MNLTKKEKEQLLALAKRALHGLPESTIFMGIFSGPNEGRVERIEFLMQLGYAILHNKTIIIPAPYDTEVPAKLVAVADRIVRYNPEDPMTLEPALTQALTEVCAKVQ